MMILFAMVAHKMWNPSFVMINNNNNNSNVRFNAIIKAGRGCQFSF